MKIEESNRLIVEFMGIKFDDYNQKTFYSVILNRKCLGYYKPEKLRFDFDWTWLMPVVEKIETITMGCVCPVFEIVSQPYLCNIKSHPQWDYDGQLYQEIEVDGDNRINATYKAVVEFIQWYNTQSK